MVAENAPHMREIEMGESGCRKRKKRMKNE